MRSARREWSTRGARGPVRRAAYSPSFPPAFAERLEHRALMPLLDVHREHLVGLAACDRRSPCGSRVGVTRRARSPRASGSRAGWTGGARRDPTPRKRSGSLSVSSTRSATLCRTSSVPSRSRIWRLVRYFPSRPENGEVLTSNVMLDRGLVHGERRQAPPRARGRTACPR